MGNPAYTAGPNADGAKSLAKESRWGVGVAIVTGIVIDTVIDALNAVDLDGQQGWWVRLATAGVATLVGLLTAYRKKNR